MHVVVAALYAVTLWVSLVAYLAITGGPWLLALALAPLLVSGGVFAILLLCAAVRGARWLWRSRGTWRWWRSLR